MTFPLEDIKKLVKQIAYSVNTGKISDYSHGMKVAIFSAKKLDGTQHLGWHYAPVSTVAGDRFHYDHGVGIDKNTDGQYVWVAPIISAQLKVLFDNARDLSPKVLTGATSNPGSIKGLFTYSDGSQKISTLTIDSSCVNRPIDIFLDHELKTAEVYKDIVSISPMPSEDLDIWNKPLTGPDRPKIGDTLIAWFNDMARSNISKPYWERGVIRSADTNGRFQNYSGLMLSGTPWTAYKSCASLSDVFKYTMGAEYANMIANKDIQNEDDKTQELAV
jgi:hypothetical protein